MEEAPGQWAVAGGRGGGLPVGEAPASGRAPGAPAGRGHWAAAGPIGAAGGQAPGHPTGRGAGQWDRRAAGEGRGPLVGAEANRPPAGGRPLARDRSRGVEYGEI